MWNPVTIVGILFLIVMFIMLYKSYERKLYTNDLKRNPYDVIKKYLLTDPDTLNKDGQKDRPILWIHVPYEYNARNWESFGSRSSYQLNQPYLYLTVKSIVAKCDKSFTIVMIDDDSFGKLIPNWHLNVGSIASPISDKIRTLGIVKLISIYGGMVCPISFLCLRDLIGLYQEGTRNGRHAFVCENVSHNINSTHNTFCPDLTMFGAPKECPVLSDLCEYISRINGTDFTAQSDFIGNYARWVKLRAEKKGDVQLVSAKAIGRQTATEGAAISVDDLMGRNYIDLDPNIVYGIYIPAQEILKRRAFEWFARMSPRQVIDSDTIIGNYMMLANVPVGREEEPMFLEPFKQRQKNWVGFWKTPLVDGLWGQKPNFLGDNLLIGSHPGP